MNDPRVGELLLVIEHYLGKESDSYKEVVKALEAGHSVDTIVAEFHKIGKEIKDASENRRANFP